MANGPFSPDAFKLAGMNIPNGTVVSFPSESNHAEDLLVWWNGRPQLQRVVQPEFYKQWTNQALTSDRPPEPVDPAAVGGRRYWPFGLAAGLTVAGLLLVRRSVGRRPG